LVLDSPGSSFWRHCAPSLWTTTSGGTHGAVLARCHAFCWTRFSGVAPGALALPHGLLSRGVAWRRLCVTWFGGGSATRVQFCFAGCVVLRFCRAPSARADTTRLRRTFSTSSLAVLAGSACAWLAWPGRAEEKLWASARLGVATEGKADRTWRFSTLAWRRRNLGDGRPPLVA